MISFFSSFPIHPANIYLFKVNDINTRNRCEIYLKLTIKTSERHHWRRSNVFLVNFEHSSHLFLVFLLLTFEKVNVSWEFGKKGIRNC